MSGDSAIIARTLPQLPCGRVGCPAMIERCGSPAADLRCLRVYSSFGWICACFACHPVQLLRDANAQRSSARGVMELVDGWFTKPKFGSGVMPGDSIFRLHANSNAK